MKPIKGGFYVLVVPKVELKLLGPMDIPRHYATRHSHISDFSAVADADPGRACGFNPWAFEPDENKKVVAALRELADFMENETIRFATKKG